MKKTTVIALGLVILCVSLVVWGQIFTGTPQNTWWLRGEVTTDTPSPIEVPEPSPEPGVTQPGDNGSPSTPTPQPEPAPTTPDTDTPVACTEDAKICPDGSSVGRVAPSCEFAACPTTDGGQSEMTVYTCTPEMKQAEACTMEYAPVCGMREVQCVTTPCNPIPETFGNACGACATPGVNTYTVGECAL